MAKWLALTDLYLSTGYLQAGTAFETDTNFRPPTNAVQPRDAFAVEMYRAEGPRGCDDAEPFRALFTNCGRWTGIPVPGPSIQWVKEGKGWVLIREYDGETLEKGNRRCLAIKRNNP